MNTNGVAKEFAGESVRWVGIQYGSRYADGGRDFREYFESESGKHVVVEYTHVSREMWARKSDGIVW